MKMSSRERLPVEEEIKSMESRFELKMNQEGHKRRAKHGIYKENCIDIEDMIVLKATKEHKEEDKVL